MVSMNHGLSVAIPGLFQQNLFVRFSIINSTFNRYYFSGGLPDHRFIKRRTRPMPGLKSFSSAAATLEGIEVTQMIHKRQFNSDRCGFVQFADLAG